MVDKLSRVYEALGMSRHQFAQMLGIADGTLKGWEKGSETMSMNTIKVLHNKFGLSYDYLMGQGRATGNEKIDRLIALLEEVETIRKEISK